MGFRVVRLALTMCVAGALCQEQQDAATYASFLSTVADMRSALDNGEKPAATDPTVAALPRIQYLIGLSDAEANLLNATAATYSSAMRDLYESRTALTLESLFEFVETGKHSDAIQQRLKDVESKRDELAMTQIRRLKAALPAASFAKIDVYVHTRFRDRKNLSASPGPSKK
jgi:hypothetical protein